MFLKNSDPHIGHHSESALTIHRMPDSQKCHHQISTADLPTNKQSNFSVMYSTQNVKHQSEFYLNNLYRITTNVRTTIYKP
jgi:hypothetical protein